MACNLYGMVGLPVMTPGDGGGAAFPPSLPVSRLYGRDLDFETVFVWKRELFCLEGGLSCGPRVDTIIRNYVGIPFLDPPSHSTATAHAPRQTPLPPLPPQTAVTAKIEPECPHACATPSGPPGERRLGTQKNQRPRRHPIQPTIKNSYTLHMTTT